MNSLSVFEFESNQIRVVLIDGEPWFVVKDVAKILEHSNPSMLVQPLKDREKGVNQIYTPGGNQEMAIISESGLYRILMRSDKLKAEIFQDWIAEDVIPSIRKTGSYQIGIKDPIELIIESAQQLLEVKRRVEESEKEIAQIKQDVSTINQRAIAAETELKSLPTPVKSASTRTTRNNINSLIRGFCHRNNVTHVEAYKNLYREFRDRYHIDLKIRAANGKSAPLDIAESLDVVEDLYALACDMFGGVNA